MYLVKHPVFLILKVKFKDISEYDQEMPQSQHTINIVNNAAFHQVRHCLLRQNQSSEKEIYIYFFFFGNYNL